MQGDDKVLPSGVAKKAQMRNSIDQANITGLHMRRECSVLGGLCSIHGHELPTSGLGKAGPTLCKRFLYMNSPTKNRGECNSQGSMLLLLLRLSPAISQLFWYRTI